MESLTGKANQQVTLTITVRLHATLRLYQSQGQERGFPLELPEGSVVRDVLERLGITLPTDALLLVIQHRVVDHQHPLLDGDHLDIFPAISGG